MPVKTLVVANLWAAAWGVANVLCGLCFVRIGVALTGAILTGLGVSLGRDAADDRRKAPGLFQDAAESHLARRADGAGGGGRDAGGRGILAALAGFGRDQVLRKTEQRSGSFLAG